MARKTMRITGGGRLKRHVAKQRRDVAAMPRSVEAGFFDDNDDGKGMPVTSIAAWHEFGTKDYPERPFMRQARETMRTPIKTAIKSGGLVVDQALAKGIGETMEGEIRGSIERNGLVDTGRLRRSVTHKVT